nr:hypothetical protein CFP56_09668 [Quercus suber]
MSFRPQRRAAVAFGCPRPRYMGSGTRSVQAQEHAGSVSRCRDTRNSTARCVLAVDHDRVLRPSFNASPPLRRSAGRGAVEASSMRYVQAGVIRRWPRPDGPPLLQYITGDGARGAVAGPLIKSHRGIHASDPCYSRAMPSIGDL